MIRDVLSQDLVKFRSREIRVNTLRPRQNNRHFPDEIFKCIFLNENVWISTNISLKFVPKGSINNIPALVQIMAWRRSGDKPSSEPMMVRSPTHMCVTRPQWVKTFSITAEMRRCRDACQIPERYDHYSIKSHSFAWWRHQMEAFSALLAICAGNSPVPGDFPTQRPVTRSFDVFFDLCLNKRLSEQSWGWWFEKPSRPLWRHCDGDFFSSRRLTAE